MIQAKLKSFRELKAEKANRLENWRLQLRIRLMDKESGHKAHLTYVERKAIVRQMESVRRTTGYSPLSVQPLPADRALKDSQYFTSNRRLSERALRKWRVQEALLERDLRLSDLEVRKHEEQQAALVRLLVDLGVIGESSQVERLGQQVSQAPQQQQQQQRPFTASAGPLPPLAEKPVREQQQQQQRTVSAAPAAGGKAQMQAPRRSLPQQPQQPQQPRRAVTFSVDAADSQEAEAAAVVSQPMPQLPQWKRQLRYEAPPALGAQRESTRVRLAVSKSALRRELQQMVDAHEKDPVKIAQAEAARREQSRLAMQQTVGHMRRMSLLPPEGHDPARRGSVPALLQLDRASSGSGSDGDGDDDDDNGATHAED